MVVYDGECALCNRFVRLLRRWDRRNEFELLPFQDPSVPRRFPWIPAEAFQEALQVIGEEGRTWAGARGVEEILRRLPPGRFLSYLFHLPFARRVASAVYRRVAENRRRLGCAEHCGFGTAEPGEGEEAR